MILRIFYAVIIISALLFGGLIAYEEIIAKSKKKKEESLPRHDHDCLVEECDFHSDIEVDTMMRQWLRDNKLRGVVLREHSFKEYALNLFIAEVATRRPLKGETTWNDEQS